MRLIALQSCPIQPSYPACLPSSCRLCMSCRARDAGGVDMKGMLALAPQGRVLQTLHCCQLLKPAPSLALLLQGGAAALPRAAEGANRGPEGARGGAGEAVRRAEGAHRAAAARE